MCPPRVKRPTIASQEIENRSFSLNSFAGKLEAARFAAGIAHNMIRAARYICKGT